ncbi:helix-turn-helix domain-containing protein [Mucilaginibacter calamicampi]|uniref:Helix-turn-helix domain-containing protein n=1 Tax=Mucilaginibacter calamicampi TaxID=1302352 RepID=A0ABW2Z084_9SPHI
MTISLLFFTCSICFVLMALIALFNPARVNIAANRWMGLFYISAACITLNPAIYSFGFARKLSFVMGFNELSHFAMMPALYLAIVQFTTPAKKINVTDYLHLLPWAIFAVVQISALSGHNFLTWQQAQIFSWLSVIGIRSQFIIYWVLAYKRLSNHQKHIRLIIADVEPVSLNWLKYLLGILGLMLLCFYISVLFKVGFSSVIAPCIYLAGSLGILYYSLAQKEIYPYQPEELKSIRQVFVDVKDNAKTTKQRLTDEEASRLKARLDYLMTAEKLYLDPELNLPQLAQLMPVTVNDLSYLLNVAIGTNFFQFVNAHRVEEAKQLMLSEQYKHLNLLGIAYHAGFNSKTTFNTAFKKETGLSPTQFIQKEKNGQLVSTVV